MSEGYKTKFNIDDTVWFIEEETEYAGNCPCCGGRLSDKKVNKVHKTTVDEIFINRHLENYNLSFPRCLPAQKLYATRNEAEQHLND